MRFSLRSFFVALTLACMLLAGITQSQIARWESIDPPSGRGLRLRVGRLSCGVADWAGDDRGRVIGVWWQSETPWLASGLNARQITLLEFELTQSRSAAP